MRLTGGLNLSFFVSEIVGDIVEGRRRINERFGYPLCPTLEGVVVRFVLTRAPFTASFELPLADRKADVPSA